ncbi:MAG: hypothetical protein RLZZ360_610 [Candidatus Parcubacteria bacterium]|jgi:hypothetical protein
MRVLKIVALVLVIGYASTVYALPNLRPSPQAPYGPFYVGQAPLFYFNLANTGPDNAGTAPPAMNSNWVVVDTYADDNYPVGIGSDGAWLWSGDTFGPVSAGSTITVRNGALTMVRWPENDWCAPLGTHQVKYEADYSNGVAETSEGDNTTAWNSFSVVTRPTGVPDLTAATTSSALGPFILGQPIMLPFVIANSGDTISTALTRAQAQVDLYADTAEPHVDLFKKDYPAVPVGSSTIFAFNWTSAVAGVHRVRVKYVDDRYTIDEENECNNTSPWVTFTVIAANIEASTTPQSVASGYDMATTTYYIRNTSNIDVSPYPYRITIGGQVVASGTSTAGVAANTAWTPITVPVTWTAPINAATQTLAMVVEVTDPTNGVESASSTLTVAPASGPLPRLIVCKAANSLLSGGTTSVSARYWINSPTPPVCSWGGFINVSGGAVWSSVNTSVATVTYNGARTVITGLDLGETEVVALYSGLYATTAVEVVDQPLLLTITPTTNFVRYGSTVNFSVTVESGVDMDCTISGGIAAPIFITHPASPLSSTYGPYTSINLTSTQQIKIDCIDPVDPTNSASEKATIEIVPIAREV